MNIPTQTETLKGLIELAKKWEKKSCTHQFNLLDELHANENAHTRILVRLLQIPVLLKSFLEYLKEIFPEKATFAIPEKLSSNAVSEFSDYIDAKIETKNFCIIIENKINYAVDQHRQIERYVTAVQQTNRNIFVLYLTLNGDKQPTQESIGETNGETILEINYRDHILYWLENKISFSVSDTLQQPFLQSGILQYIDHLKGRLGIRKNERDKHLDQIKEYLQLQKRDIFDVISELQYLKAYWRIYFTRNIPAREDWNQLPNELKVEILFDLCGQFFNVNRTTDNRNCFVYEGDIFSLEAVTASKISLLQIDIHYSGNFQGSDQYKEFLTDIRNKDKFPPHIEFEYNGVPCLRVAINTAMELKKLLEFLDLKSDFSFTFAEIEKSVDQFKDYFYLSKLEDYLVILAGQSDLHYEEKYIWLKNEQQINKSYFYNHGRAIQLTQKAWKQSYAIDLWNKDDGDFSSKLIRSLNRKDKIYPYSCRWWNGKFYLHFPLLSLEDDYTKELSQMLYNIYQKGINE